MSYIYKITLALCGLLAAALVDAQPNDNPDCHPTGPFISTAPVPYTGQGFQTNTWDWTREHLPASNNANYVSQSALNNNPLPAGLESPFYQMGVQYLSAIARGVNSDFRSADGWELVRKDFGTLHDGSQNGACSPAPYFILYNKYSGKLRVIASAYGLGLHQIVNIDLKFAAQADWSNLSISGYKTSGLFTHYNDPPYALDQQPPAMSTVYSAPAVFPSSDYSFFYGDFQMAYDPCTCQFQSGLEVNFRIVDQLSVQLGGAILGTDIPLTDNVAQNRIDPTHTWLSSVAQNNGDVNGGLQVYNNIHQMTQDFYTLQQNYENAVGESQEISAAIGLVSSLFSAAGQIAGGMDNTTELGGYLQAVGSVTDYFGSQVQTYSGVEGPPTEPFVLYAQTQLAGNIVESTTVGAGSIIMGTPGSAGSPSLPEVVGNSPYNVPPYPEYNEIMGVFALLKSPRVIRYKWTDVQVTPVETLYYPNHAYKLYDPSDIQYAFNPAANVDLSKTQIVAAWEDDWDNSAMGYSSASDNIYQFSVPDGNLKPINFYKDKIIELSPFMDLAHFQNLCINPPIDGGFPSVSGQPDPNFQEKSSDNLYIKFNIVFVSNNIGGSGQPNTSIFSIKYKIPAANIIDVTVPNRTAGYTGTTPDPFPPISFSPYVALPAPGSALTISSSTTLSTDLSGYADIYINAPITNTGSTPIKVIASNSITVGDGGSVGPGITLEIEPYGGIAAGSDIPPYSDVPGFCSGSLYKANQPMNKTDETSTTNILRSDFALAIYPNPAMDICHVLFEMPEATTAQVSLYDMMGRQVKLIGDGQYDAGKAKLDFSTADLAAGVYTVRYTDGAGHSGSQRLTVVHNDK